MAYGKLVVVKTKGERPIFGIEMVGGMAIIPSLDDWLLSRLGQDVNFELTDARFTITDLAMLRKLEGK